MMRLIGSEASALSSACTRRNGGMVFQPGGWCTPRYPLFCSPPRNFLNFLGPASRSIDTAGSGKVKVAAVLSRGIIHVHARLIDHGGYVLSAAAEQHRKASSNTWGA